MAQKYGIKGRLEKVFRRVAYSKDISFPQRIFLYPLYLLSLFYGAVVKIRLALYSSGLLNAGRLGCKVVSVGNITVGGTGKTPVVEFVARKLRDKGLRIAILSRGYKRKGRGITIVSDGTCISSGPEEAGDEPFMLAKRLRGVSVVVGTDRYEAGIYALKRFPLDAIVLDDGFQHIRLKRDLDILLIDGEKGFGNERLLPAGPLREPLSGMKRASLFLINKTSAETGVMFDRIKEYHPEHDCFRSGYKADKLVSLWSGEQTSLERLSGSRISALSAIANPSSFLNMLSSLGGTIVSEVSFPDHYRYNVEDLEGVVNRARLAGADFIVTTEKDAVKLEQFEPKMGIPVYYLEISLDMYGEEQRFIDAVIRRIQG